MLSVSPSVSMYDENQDDRISWLQDDKMTVEISQMTEVCLNGDITEVFFLSPTIKTTPWLQRQGGPLWPESRCDPTEYGTMAAVQYVEHCRRTAALQYKWSPVPRPCSCSPHTRTPTWRWSTLSTLSTRSEQTCAGDDWRGLISPYSNFEARFYDFLKRQRKS